MPPPRADQEAFPVTTLGAAAAGIGHVYNAAEIDGSTRYEVLVIESRGYYYPSLAVEGVRVAAGLDSYALKLTFGESLQLGDIAIPTDPRSRALIDYAGPQGTIHHVPAIDILNGKGLERVKDRLVFVGATAVLIKASLVALAVPPMAGITALFMMLQTLTSIVQALIFSLLATVYLYMMLPHEEHGPEESHAEAHATNGSQS